MRLNLRGLIFLLITVSSFLVLSASLYSINRLQRATVIQDTLDGNQIYANKLGATLEHYLQDAQKALKYTANSLSPLPPDSGQQVDGIEHLLSQTAYFNSIFVVDTHGIVLNIRPSGLQFLEKKPLQSLGNRLALSKQTPLITPPNLSSAGNLVIQLSHPLRNAQGDYQGYLGGAIYLHDSALLRIVDQNPFKNGTYVYVVNQDGQLVYHPDQKRIGEFIRQSPVVQRLMQGASGIMQFANSQGIEMLAGYVALPELGWGIVVQRPLAAALLSQEALMLELIMYLLPLLLLMLPLLWWLTNLISRPLQHLANMAQHMADQNTLQQIQETRSWYFEAREMKKALAYGVATIQEKIQRLDQEANRDAMTGLCNRRELDRTLKNWSAQSLSFTVISIFSRTSTIPTAMIRETRLSGQ